MVIRNFHDDVVNPDNLKAEDVALEAMTAHFDGHDVSIEDLRSQNLKWDFVIHHGSRTERVDVKHDSYFERTGRIPFEVYHVFGDGRIDPSWGVNGALHTLALVPWSFSKVVMVPLPLLRGYLVYSLILRGRETLETVWGWKWFERRNSSRTNTWVTHGAAIPREGFENYLKHFALGKLIELPTAEKHHREMPRIIHNGRDVRTGKEVA